MEMLRDMFPTRSEKELKEVLGEASQDCDRAVEMLLARPAAKPPPRPRPLQNLSKRASNVIEAPPLTPATASAISFGNMSLSEDLSRRKEPTTPRRKIIAISSDEAEPERDRESETVSHILAIFPDACPETTRKLYQEHQVLQGSNIAEFLANKYAEGGYIKAEKAGQKRKRQVSEEDEDDARKKTTYDPEGRPPVTAEYRKLADDSEKLLQQEFPVMPASYINKVYKQNCHFLASTYPHLVAAEKQASSKDQQAPYKPLLSRRKILDDGGAPKMGKIWSEMMEELEYARSSARKAEMERQLELDARIAAELNEKEHEAMNMLWECQCCFTETPFDNMTHCGEGAHFFCLECARMNAENEIGNGRHKLKCMDSSGCQAEFPRREVLRFIKNEKTLSLLSKLEAEEAVRIADIDDLEQCPFCDNAAICNSIDIDKEFRCDNEDCGIVSCRLCKRKSHVPRTCEEAAKEDKISQRHRIEEAMTNAMMRKCNKCKSPFIKQDGCNKMSCMKPGCYNIQCYVCSKDIKDYTHFQTGPDGRPGTGTCPLFDNHEERHEEEIRKAALAETEKLRAENPGISEEDLAIQLSEDVRKREEERRKAAAQGGRVAVPRPDYIPPYVPGAVRQPAARAPAPAAPYLGRAPTVHHPVAAPYNGRGQAAHPPAGLFPGRAQVPPPPQPYYNPRQHAPPQQPYPRHQNPQAAQVPPPYQAPVPYQPHQYQHHRYNSVPNIPVNPHRPQHAPVQAPAMYVPAAHAPPQPAAANRSRRGHR